VYLEKRQNKFNFTRLDVTKLQYLMKNSKNLIYEQPAMGVLPVEVGAPLCVSDVSGKTEGFVEYEIPLD
jgi:hypothetical protein